MKKLIPIALIFCLATQFTALRAFTSHHENPPEGRGKSIPLQQTARGRQMIKVDSFLLRIVPPSSGVQFYGDGIIFLSQSKDEARMLPEHVSFGTLQAYYGVL
ncbi:MAG TPA: hypothetical protein VK861_08730, partial [Bacteroidales bacterium]|nr:hypothetical protein [Bacteroidales bacterium]